MFDKPQQCRRTALVAREVPYRDGELTTVRGRGCRVDGGGRRNFIGFVSGLGTGGGDGDGSDDWIELIGIDGKVERIEKGRPFLAS